MFAHYNMKVSAFAFALALVGTVFSAHAVLERVGPVDPAPAVGNFPAWYQDTTGIGLEFCAPTNASEVAGGWCLLLPGDVTPPEVFPTNFFDEHFYFAASATLTTPAGANAVMVLAEEAAFATGPAVPGDQITFSRIRVRLGPVPVSGTYRFIHPYGEETIEAVAGDRIFFSDDVGVGCGGNFNCAMASRLGPFLLPSATPGGAEMPPLNAANPIPDPSVAAPTAYPGTGKSYIADPARLGPVTGSPLPNFIDSQTRSRNHNIFRIEGPPGSALGGAGVDAIETTDFSLQGRLFTGVMPGRSTVDRASYTGDSSNTTAAKKLDVFATALLTTQGRLPAAARPAAVTATLSFYDKPCSGVPDGLGGVLPPFGAPAAALGAVETAMRAGGQLQWGQSAPTLIPTDVCLKDGTARNANGVVVPVYVPAVVTDEVTVTKALFDPNLGTLAVNASSSDPVAGLVLTNAEFQGDLVGGQIVQQPLLVPPSMALTESNKKGARRQQVSTGFVALTQTVLPVAINDSFTFPMNTALVPIGPQTLAVLANDSNVAGGTVTLTTNPAMGTAVVNANGTVRFTPNLNASGTDSFAYTVTVGANVSNAGIVTLNITPVNVAPVAVGDSFNALANQTASLNVLANDTDVNGAANIAAPVIVSGPAGAAATVNGRNVDFTATASGTYTFTYRAVDAGIAGFAPLQSDTATVTVQVAAAEALAFTRSEFVRNSNRLRAEGTITPATGQLITLQFIGGACSTTNVCPAGSVTADVAGLWAFDGTVPLPNANVVSILARSPNGTTAAAALRFR